MPTQTSTTPPKLVSYSDSKQIRSFLLAQFFGTIPPIPPSALLSDLASRTVIITGSNSGLGLEAAKQLYTLGVGRLILACRSVQKGEDARRTILSSATPPPTQTAKQTIDIYELDMSSVASIVAFSQRVKALNRIDTIVLNAGVDLRSYRKNNPEGYEMTLMVNVIGTFVLAALMVPILRQSSTRNKLSDPPRISIISSAVHFFAKYDLILQAAASGEGILCYLSNEARWTGKIGQDRYLLSKGCVQMLVGHLAGLITASTSVNGKPAVIVHGVQPGYCRTNLFNEDSSFAGRAALRLIGWTAEVGGRALVAGAIGKEGGEKSHGEYMSEGHVRDGCSWLATDQGKQTSAKLWDEVAAIIERAQPGTVSSL